MGGMGTRARKNEAMKGDCFPCWEKRRMEGVQEGGEKSKLDSGSVAGVPRLATTI